LAGKLPCQKEYLIGGGGEHGPSQAAKSCCLVQSLGSLFIFFFPVRFLETIAQETNRYGNEEWVCPVSNGRFDASEDNDSGVEEMEVEEECQQPKYILKPCLESPL
jgi:hypothetical protein